MSSHKERVTFTLMAPDAREVYLAGSFNDWTPADDKMKQNRSGLWRRDKKLLPGTYEYKFVVDGAWVIDPDCPTSVPNPHGTANSCIEVVSGSTAETKQAAYVAKIKEKMAKWQREIDKLEAKAEKAKDASKVKYQKQIAALREKSGEFEEKLEELRRSGGKAWEDLKEGVESAWKSLSDSIKSAKSKFK